MASQRQIEANRRNWAKRRGLTPEGRERLRLAALRDRPWEHSTGPRTEDGKLKSRRNALFSFEYCRTVEPLASIDRLRRQVVRLGYFSARAALLCHRLSELAREEGVSLDDVGKRDGTAAGTEYGERERSTALAADVARILTSLGHNDQQQPKTEAAARERSEGDIENGPWSSKGRDRFLAIRTELDQIEQASAEDKPLRLKAWQTVAAVCGVPALEEQTTFDSQQSEEAFLQERISAHLLKLPTSMGTIAYGRVCLSILKSICWFCEASEGRWGRSWQLMTRRIPACGAS